MRAAAIHVALAILWVIPTAADSGDDSTNNLFTDLAPVLALFGEQFAKQFMSQSMGWLDHIIFAMAPLGILTAIVAAIRVGGPSWLRAIVGRARENRATVEIELMSSTSHEVCELWNGHGVVRTMGQPEVGQIIYLEAHREDMETFGLYTIESAKHLLRPEPFPDPLADTLRNMLDTLRNILGKKGDSIPPRTETVTGTDGNSAKQSPVLRAIRSFFSRKPTEAHDDEESNPREVSSLPLHEASGLSSLAVPSALGNQPLNVSGERQQPTAATEGPDSGSEIEARVDSGGLRSVDNESAPNISLNIHGSSSTMDLYVFALCGLILQFGMLVFCGFSVYHPTFSLRFHKSGQKVAAYAYPIMATGTITLAIGMVICSAIVEGSTKEEVYVPVAQGDHVDGSSGGPESRILWLQKSHVVSDQKFDSFVIFGQDGSSSRYPVLTSRRDTENELSVRTEFHTILGVALGLAGFVLQFQGLRGMNWSASIALLVCMALMTACRAWIRRKLTALPISRKVLENHEMDWLALRIAGSDGGSSRWASDEAVSLVWEIYTGSDNYAYDGSFDPVGPVGVASQSESQSESHPESHPDLMGAPLSQSPSSQAERALNIRRRLGQLTKWTGQTSLVAISVARSIGVVMNTFFNGHSKGSFTWFLRVQIGDMEDKIPLRIRKPESDLEWEIDATYIEAALSLWAFHIRTSEAQKEISNEKGFDKDWLQENVQLKRQVFQLLGQDEASGALRRDIKWWIGDVNYESAVLQDQRFAGTVGFVNKKSVEQASDPRPLGIVTKTSLESSLAQHIFSSFMWAVAAKVEPKKLNGAGETSITHGDLLRPEDPETLLSLRIQNKVISKMADALQETGLGSLQGAYMCIIPPLSSSQALPAEVVIDFVRQRMLEYEALGRWGVAVPLYRKLFQECKAFGQTHRDFQRATAVLIHVFVSISNTLTQWKDQKREDSVHGLSELRKTILEEFGETDLRLKQSFVELGRIQNRWREDLWKGFIPEVPDLPGDVHGYFKHHTIFSMIMRAQYNEIDRIKDQAKETDICGWTPLHYAAVRGDEHIIGKLFKSGADPNAADLAGWTPLHYFIQAASKSEGGPYLEWKLELGIGALLRNGANTEIRGRDGIGPIHCAALMVNSGAKATSLLLQAGTNVDMQDNSRRTPLHWAAHTGAVDVVRALLQKGAYKGARDDYGRIPLHLAAAAGKHDVVGVLLEKGRSENDSVDRDGRTPFHLAAMSGDEKTMHELVGRAEGQGNDQMGHVAIVGNYANTPNVIKKKDNRHCTALDHATILGHEAVARRLWEICSKEAKSWTCERTFALGVWFARQGIVALTATGVGERKVEESLSATRRL